MRAAPKPVASSMGGRSITTWSRSLWICMSRLFAGAAVDAKSLQGRARVSRHGVEQIDDL